jgi:hypothetical protein
LRWRGGSRGDLGLPRLRRVVLGERPGPDRGHVSECDYVEGAGQEYDVTVKWSVRHWYLASVKSSDLAAATGARPFTDLTGRVLDLDDGDPDAELSAYLDELGSGCDPDSDDWRISALYDTRRDQPRRVGT